MFEMFKVARQKVKNAIRDIRNSKTPNFFSFALLLENS